MSKLQFVGNIVFQEYKFEEENPLINHENPFQAGIDKLQEGDIPNAVLLFEAAVQKNDQHVEVCMFIKKTAQLCFHSKSQHTIIK